MDTTIDKSSTSFRKKSLISVSFTLSSFSHSSLPSVVKKQQKNGTYDHEDEDVFNNDCIVSSPAVPLGLPIYLPERIINGQDPLRDLIDQKRKWTRDRDRLIAANLKNPVYKSTIVNDDLTFPTGVVKLADHIDRDPDPYFSGEYNWYYTDGNLKTVRGDNFNLLASSRFSVPGVVMLQSIRPDEGNKQSLCLTGSEISLHTGSTQPMLQITSYNNIVATRQKNNVCLFNIESDDGLNSERCHKYESTASITSLSIAPGIALNGEYCTLTAPNVLKVWVPFWKNVTKAEGVMGELSSSDNWGNVKYVSENTILHANRNLVSLKDLRYQLNKRNGRTWMKMHVNSCEEVCNTVLSKQVNNKCYVATTHQLLELDFRKSFSKRWTHMMDYPPSLGFSIQSKDTDEIVTLGSQGPDEVCCVLTTGNNTPYHLPSPNDTLRKCRLEGICLDPSLTSRCNLSVSGLDSYCVEDNIFLVRQTNVGDLFYQKINTSCGNSREAELDFEDLRLWEKRCAQRCDTISSSALTVSNEINYGTLFNSISKKIIRSETTFKGKLPKSSPWNMSKKKMLKSKSSFLECLLDAWEIEDDPEWYDPKQEELDTTISSVETGTKVSGWLNNMLGFAENVSITAEEISEGLI